VFTNKVIVETFTNIISINYTQTFVVWSIKAASGLNWTLIIVSAEYLSIREKNVLN